MMPYTAEEREPRNIKDLLVSLGYDDEEEKKRRERNLYGPNDPNVVAMQDGGLVGEAEMLQNAGRGGDSMLVHMNPEEVGALNQLGDSGIGGLRKAQMTINPETGLPEMFQLSSLLPMIAGIAASAMGGAPLVVAAASAAGSAGADVVEGRDVDLGRALMSGVASYAGSSIAGDVATPAAAAKISAGEAGQLANIGSNVEGFVPAANIGGSDVVAGYNLAGASPSDVMANQAAYSMDVTAARQAAGEAAEGGIFSTAPGAGVPYDAGIGGGAVDVAGPVWEGAGRWETFPTMPPAQGAAYQPVDMGVGLDYGGSYAGPTYGEGTPMDPNILEVAQKDPGAFDAALRAKGGTTPFSPEEVRQNIGREIWQKDAGRNIREGLSNITPAWSSSKPGEVAAGDLAQRGMIALGAGAASLPPPEYDYTLPERKTYGPSLAGPAEWENREYVEPPINYRPGRDPEHEYWRPEDEFGMLPMMANNGYRGRSDLPTVYAAEGGQATFPYGFKEGLVDWSTPSAGFGPPKPAREWSQENLPDWFQKLEDPFNITPKLEKIYSKAPKFVTGGLTDSYKRSLDPEYGLKDPGYKPPPPSVMTRDGVEDEEEQDLLVVNAAEGFRSGERYEGGGLKALMGGILPQLAQMYLGREEGDMGYGSPEDVSAPSPDDLLQQPRETGWSDDDTMPSLYSHVPPGYQRARFALGTEGMVVEDAAAQQLPPPEAAAVGIMEGAPPAAQDALEERMAVTPSPNEPQNPEERAILEQALLALEGLLDPEAASQAIDEFIETFGPEAYRELMALVENDLDGGGIVKPANGETTVAMGEVQGPDVIPGNIVKKTGERIANLNVGENEYIMDAEALARKGMAAGMPRTPENGALAMGAEEEALEAMYG